MACACGRVLPLNGGTDWLYEETREMSHGERMVFRARHADPRETRGLISMIAMAQDILFAQQPHILEKSQ